MESNERPVVDAQGIRDQLAVPSFGFKRVLGSSSDLLPIADWRRQLS